MVKICLRLFLIVLEQKRGAMVQTALHVVEAGAWPKDDNPLCSVPRTAADLLVNIGHIATAGEMQPVPRGDMTSEYWARSAVWTMSMGTET